MHERQQPLPAYTTQCYVNLFLAKAKDVAERLDRKIVDGGLVLRHLLQVRFTTNK
jgi:hypothetical protein